MARQLGALRDSGFGSLINDPSACSGSRVTYSIWLTFLTPRENGFPVRGGDCGTICKHCFVATLSVEPLRLVGSRAVTAHNVSIFPAGQVQCERIVHNRRSGCVALRCCRDVL